MAKQINVPVQGHYGTLDKVALAKDAKEFEKTLGAQGTPIEMFYYEGVGHGFYDYTWQTEQEGAFGYNAAAADKAAAAVWITGAIGLAIGTSYWWLGIIVGAVTTGVMMART